MRKCFVLALASGFIVMLGCSLTSKADNFNGLTGMDGKQVKHYGTTNYAIHVLGVGPIWGNATLQQTVSDFAKQAKAAGASAVRVVQSDTSTLWWVLPPISFVIHPVIGNVAGDAR
jgi:hypothetical protein